MGCNHGPVGSQRPQPTVRLRRRSTSGEPVPGLRVWGFARSSRHIGEPGWTMSRIMSGKVPSEVRGNRAAVARGEHVGERSNVLRRIAVQDHQVRRLARSDAPGRRRPADDRRWRRRERRKDLETSCRPRPSARTHRSGRSRSCRRHRYRRRRCRQRRAKPGAGLCCSTPSERAPMPAHPEGDVARLSASGRGRHPPPRSRPRRPNHLTGHSVDTAFERGRCRPHRKITVLARGPSR